MLADLGPGVAPYQFALVQAPPSRTLYLFYWAVKYVTRQRLEAAGWDTRDPVFYEQCQEARPHGAVELSWLPRHVLQGQANPTLPRIPRNQVRYLPARVYGVIVKNLASILEAVRPAFVQAAVGAGAGVGLTDYGPVDSPFKLDLTDLNGRREHYTVGMRIQTHAAFSTLAQQHRQSALFQHLEDFGNGGVTLTLTYAPLTAKGRSKKAHTINVIFPLDPLRVILRAKEKIVFAQGRLAALL